MSCVVFRILDTPCAALAIGLGREVTDLRGGLPCAQEGGQIGRQRFYGKLADHAVSVRSPGKSGGRGKPQNSG